MSPFGQLGHKVELKFFNNKVQMIIKEEKWCNYNNTKNCPSKINQTKSHTQGDKPLRERLWERKHSEEESIRLTVFKC